MTARLYTAAACVCVAQLGMRHCRIVVPADRLALLYSELQQIVQVGQLRCSKCSTQLTYFIGAEGICEKSKFEEKFADTYNYIMDSRDDKIKKLNMGSKTGGYAYIRSACCILHRAKNKK